MRKLQPPDRKRVTDGCTATYRRAATQLIVKSHDELNGRRRGPDVRHDEGYQWRRAAGHRDRMPGAAGPRSPIKGPLVEDRRSPNGERDRRMENEIAKRRTRSPNEERDCRTLIGAESYGRFEKSIGNVEADIGMTQDAL
ncbi:hypothetical protein JG688_00015492 [Phytophthora aleatoria]|uniref:Uncharacterized protein n=1 Tax=Phytophthora aleatoria TaxID=2496075 RepID=A0A8J5IFN4_9STRA|nr:hypothetical protein JG688_00015492 [Phytophthora aleatoria]